MLNKKGIVGIIVGHVFASLIGGLHSLMELVGDGVPEDRPCLRVQGLQGRGREIGGHVAGHEQIHIEDELHFSVGFSRPLDFSRTRMELHPAAAPDGKLGIHTGLSHTGLHDLLIAQDAEVFLRNQIAERRRLQREGLAGDEVDIAQADALKIGGLVDLDERRKGLIQSGSKILPAGIAGTGEGDKLLGQIHPPDAVLGHELVVDGGGLILHAQITGNAGELGRGGFHPGRVTGKCGADGLLKLHGRLCSDGEDLRKTELTDDLSQLVAAVGHTRFGGKHSIDPFRFLSTIINPEEEKGKGPNKMFKPHLHFARICYN